MSNDAVKPEPGSIVTSQGTYSNEAFGNRRGLALEAAYSYCTTRKEQGVTAGGEGTLACLKAERWSFC